MFVGPRILQSLVDYWRARLAERRRAQGEARGGVTSPPASPPTQAAGALGPRLPQAASLPSAPRPAEPRTEAPPLYRVDPAARDEVPPSLRPRPVFRGVPPGPVYLPLRLATSPTSTPPTATPPTPTPPSPPPTRTPIVVRVPTLTPTPTPTPAPPTPTPTPTPLPAPMRDEVPPTQRPRPVTTQAQEQAQGQAQGATTPWLPTPLRPFATAPARAYPGIPTLTPSGLRFAETASDILESWRRIKRQLDAAYENEARKRYEAIFGRPYERVPFTWKPSPLEEQVGRLLPSSLYTMYKAARQIERAHEAAKAHPQIGPVMREVTHAAGNVMNWLQKWTELGVGTVLGTLVGIPAFLAKERGVVLPLSTVSAGLPDLYLSGELIKRMWEDRQEQNILKPGPSPVEYGLEKVPFPEDLADVVGNAPAVYLNLFTPWERMAIEFASGFVVDPVAIAQTALGVPKTTAATRIAARYFPTVQDVVGDVTAWDRAVQRIGEALGAVQDIPVLGWFLRPTPAHQATDAARDAIVYSTYLTQIAPSASADEFAALVQAFVNDPAPFVGQAKAAQQLVDLLRDVSVRDIPALRRALAESTDVNFPQFIADFSNLVFMRQAERAGRVRDGQLIEAFDERLTRWLREVESTFLLGLPRYAIRNFANNTLTSLVDGVNPFSSYSQAVSFLRHFPIAQQDVLEEVKRISVLGRDAFGRMLGGTGRWQRFVPLSGSVRRFAAKGRLGDLPFGETPFRTVVQARATERFWRKLQNNAWTSATAPDVPEPVLRMVRQANSWEELTQLVNSYYRKPPLAALADWQFLTPILPDLENLWQGATHPEWQQTLRTLRLRAHSLADVERLLNGPFVIQPDDVTPVVGQALAATVPPPGTPGHVEAQTIANEVATQVQDVQDTIMQGVGSALMQVTAPEAVERVLQVFRAAMDEFLYRWADAYNRANTILDGYLLRKAEVEAMRSEGGISSTQARQILDAAWNQYLRDIDRHWRAHFGEMSRFADATLFQLERAAKDASFIPVQTTYQIENVALAGDPEFAAELAKRRDELREVRSLALTELAEYLRETGDLTPMSWLAALIKQEAEYVTTVAAMIRSRDDVYLDLPQLWEALHHDQVQLWRLLRMHTQRLRQGIFIPPRWNEITALQMFMNSRTRVSFLNELASRAGIATATAEGKPTPQHLANFLNKRFVALGLEPIPEEARDSLRAWTLYVMDMDAEHFLAAYRALAKPETPIDLFESYVLNLTDTDAKVAARAYYRWLVHGRRGSPPTVPAEIQQDLENLVRYTVEAPQAPSTTTTFAAATPPSPAAAPPTPPPSSAAPAVSPAPPISFSPTPGAVPAVTPSPPGGGAQTGATAWPLTPPIREEQGMLYLDVGGTRVYGERAFLERVWQMWLDRALPSLVDMEFDRLVDALRTMAVTHLVAPGQPTASVPPMQNAVRMTTEGVLRELDLLEALTRTVPSPEGDAAMVRQWIESIRPRFSALQAVASLAGQAFADRTLLDYAATRNVDRVLAMLFPYHFWPTRSAWNWAKRFLHNPISVAAYVETRRMIAEERKQDVGLRSRFYDKVKVPFPFLPDYFEQALYFDPFRLAIPFADLHWTNWDDIDQANNAFFRAIAIGDAFGLAPHVPHRLLFDWVTGEQGGLADYIPQAALISALLPPNQYVSGPGWLGSRWNAYRINRAIASMAADAMKIPNLDYSDLRQIIAVSRQVGKTDLQPLLPYIEAQLQIERWARGELTGDAIDQMFTNPIVREAMRRVWGERALPAVASAFLGTPLHVVATGEKVQVATQRAMQLVEREAKQGAEALQALTGTPEGRATMEAISGANPFIQARQAQYGVLPGEEQSADAVYRRVGLNATLDEIEAKWRPLIERSVREDPANFTQLDKILDAYFEERQKAFDQWLDDQNEPRLRSVYGATPEEVLAIRRLDILSIMARTRPKRDQFAAPDALVDGAITADEIDWDAYHEAYDQWLANLVPLAMKDERVRRLVQEIYPNENVEDEQVRFRLLSDILTPESMRYYIDEHLRLIEPYTALTETIRDLYMQPYRQRREEAMRRFGPDILDRYEAFRREVENRFGQDIWQRMDAYFNEVHGRFDLPGEGWQGVRDIFVIQDRFFQTLESIVGTEMIELGRQYGRLPSGSEARREMLARHPELRAYWEVREALLQQEPFTALRPYWDARRALMEKYGVTRYFDEVDALEAKYNIKAYRDERRQINELFPEFMGGKPQDFIDEVLSRYPWFRERGWDEEYLARIYEQVADIPDANIIRLINEAERSGRPLEDLLALQEALTFVPGTPLPTGVATTGERSRRGAYTASRRRARRRFFRRGGGGGGGVRYRPFLPGYTPGAIRRRERIYIP